MEFFFASVHPRLAPAPRFFGALLLILPGGFLAAQTDATFLPGGSASWSETGNWQGGQAPNAPAAVARIPAPSPDANRAINVNLPVVLGSLIFSQGESVSRNRLGESEENNPLTFQNPAGQALLQVSGTGLGFAELDVHAGVVLASHLELRIENPLGDPEFGALRLRRDWSGPGGLLKTGLGVVSLTGESKTFTGAIRIEEGVIRVTESAVPTEAAGIAVLPGGQLRLVSQSDGPARIYNFGGDLSLDSMGRSDAIPDSSGLGRLGALRYDPGGRGHHAIVTNRITLAGVSSLHVDGAGNRLELAGSLSGAFGFSKSGGGILRLSGDNAAYTALIGVDNGVLEVHGRLGSPVELSDDGVVGGAGRVGVVTGSGRVVVDGHVLQADQVDGLRFGFVFRETGDPRYDQPADSGNGVLRLARAPTGAGRIDFYLGRAAAAYAPTTATGGFFLQSADALAGLIGGSTVRVFVPDPESGHEFDGALWRAHSEATVSVVPATANFPDGTVAGHTLQVVVPGRAINYETWRMLAFPDPADRADPEISGPSADPQAAGVTNLERFAFGIGSDEDPRPYEPVIDVAGAAPVIRFPYIPDLIGAIYRIEASVDLIDWNTVIFDSSTQAATPDASGWLSVTDNSHASAGERRFYRVVVVGPQ